MGSIKRIPEAIWRRGYLVDEELVFNSLEAGATKVSVAISIGTCYIKVVDNGSGVSRDGLVLMGERYATSKYSHSDDMHAFLASFGFKGEALSSISDVSFWKFQTHGRPNGYLKVLKDGKCLYLGIDDCREDVGTIVRMTCFAHVLLLLLAAVVQWVFGIHLSSLNKLNASVGAFKL